MSNDPDNRLSPGAIPLVQENTPGDAFENAIRVIGVANACEWFGHSRDSAFAAETAQVLIDRAAAA